MPPQILRPISAYGHWGLLNLYGYWWVKCVRTFVSVHTDICIEIIRAACSIRPVVELTFPSLHMHYTQKLPVTKEPALSSNHIGSGHDPQKKESDPDPTVMEPRILSHKNYQQFF